jgi:hypothetical protein
MAPLSNDDVSTGHWQNDGQQSKDVLGQKLPQYHFVHQKFHVDYPGTEPEPW